MAGTTLISESLLHQWSDQGSSTVRSQLQTALKVINAAPNASSIAPKDRQTLYRLLYELLWIVLQAKLPRQDVLTVLNDVDLAKSPAACDVLVDLLWVIGSEVEAKEKGRERYSSPEWQALARLVRDLADEEIVPSATLQEALEVDLLHKAGLLAEPATMAKKLIRVNTKTYYTQVKFNLLREEGEGFSKVLSLLHTGVTKDQIQATKVDLMSLIGYFDLDANRVLDLALDAYEMEPQNDCFAELLGTFKRDSIPHVLGFKFQFYKRDMLDGLITPKSLYRLAATLIEKKLLDMDALMPHLSPNKEETVKQALEKVKEQEEAAKAFGKVNLAAKASESDATTDNGQIEADLLAAATKKKNEDNQVLGLIMGMLDVGAPERAFEMIKWFKDRGVDALTHEPLMNQMCQFVHVLLSNLYEPLSLKSMGLTSGSSGVKKSLTVPSSTAVKVKAYTSTSDWMDQLAHVLAVLGGNLHNDSFLFTKILRIISHHIDQANKQGSETQSSDVSEQLKKLMIQSFLPALSLQSCNPSTAFLLWDLLKNHSFDERYRLYQQWEALYAASPAMQLVEAQCVQSTRKIMRRLTADRAKPSARSLTHIAHSNPLVVFRTMLRQIQSYDNLILPVVECLKFVTPFGMDVLSYVLVSELSKSRQSMKSDGTNISMWLQSLANFSGSFYRKYPNVELGGLLQYLIRRLENWESVDLVVLSELLSKMGSCITFEDISASQLEAQAGGPHLWQEPTDPKLTNRRAIPRLRDALIKRNLALPLCLLICQVRSKMEFQEDSSLSHLKALGRMFDTSQMTLSQLLQFLNGVVDPAVYTKMLPSVSELVQSYHILPELAMTISRPAMRFEDAIFKRAPRSVHTTTPSSTSVNQGGGSVKSWDMQSPELLDDVSRAISSVQSSKDPFTGMSKELYTMFWSMILYDIYVPFQQYDAEINRLRTSIGSQNSGGTITSTERKKLKEKSTQAIDKLVTEQKDQVAHRKRVYERLEDKKSVFFQREDTQSQTAVSELLQKCIVPRAILSPEDALFCAKFMERLHHMNTPEFSTVQYYNKVTLQLPSIVLCVTEREAGNFGIFLKETMGLLYRWNQSSVTYDEEAIHGKSGFSVDLHNPAKVLTHRQYKSMYAKCHRSMVQLYCKTLASNEYMPIRNSLIVLNKLIDVFPSGKTAAECLLEIVEALTQEDREDIKIMARRYFALLTKRKSTLVEDKMLAAGLTPPKKKPVETPVAVKANDDDNEDGESGRDKAFEKDSASRDGRDRGRERERDRSSSGRDGRRGESGSSQQKRDTRRDTSASREDPLESGEVKSENSRDRNDRAAASSSVNAKRRELARNDDRLSQDGDAKRDRRGVNERESRELNPGPQKGKFDASSERERGRAIGNTDKLNREGSRRSRSRSVESRRAQRDKERNAGAQKDKDTKDSSVPPTSAPGKRDAPPAQGSGRAAGSDAKDSLSGNKRQRVETSEDDVRQKADLTEAALRRQLTEKKNQDRQESRKPSSDAPARVEKPEVRKPSSDTATRETKVESSKPLTPPLRRETEKSAPATGAVKDDTKVEPPVKKIVSLVSSSSARKREREAADEPAPSTPISNRGEEAAAGPDVKRRREGGGEKGNGSARDDAGNRGGRGDQQQLQRRNSNSANGDDRRKQGQQQQNRGTNNNQPKQKGEGGGNGGGGNTNGQQREQGRNNRPDGQRNAGAGGGNRGGDNGGGRGGNNSNGNNERRRDSNHGNNERRGGNGGNGGGGGGGGRR